MNNVFTVSLPVNTSAQRSARNAFMKSAIAYFGGATVTAGYGTWVDEKTGDVINEPVEVVHLAALGGQSDAEDVVRRLLLGFVRDAGEACGYMQVGNKAFLVYPDE